MPAALLVIYTSGMDRHNHYEAAFADFLRQRHVCHLAIDETRRSYLGDQPAKSLDFILHGQCGERYVVDIKGRKFPGGTPQRPRHCWESWATREDVEDARFWAAKFGAGYRALLIFGYHVTLPEADPDQIPVYPGETGSLWKHQRYLWRAALVEEYLRVMKPRSRKWDTVDLPRGEYARVVRPLQHFLQELRWNVAVLPGSVA